MSVNLKISMALAVLGWIIGSSLWEGREKNRQAIAGQLRENYSAREVVDLLFEAKHSAGVWYVVYGFLIGAAFASAYIP